MTAPKKTRQPMVTFRSLTGSPSARKLATAVLEVLAGVATPVEAGKAAGLSLQRYYALEARALQGLVTGLEPRAKGRHRSAESDLAALNKDNVRLQREVGRLQALVRAAHRASGLVEVKQVKKAVGRRKHRAAPRAVKAVAVLRQQAASGDDGVVGPASQEA
jgi:hypothetical protein